MKDPLLTIDIGNTSIAVALFANAQHETVLKQMKIVRSNHPSNDIRRQKLINFLGRRLSSTAIDIVLSSVVPAETRLMYPLIKLLGRRILRVHHRLNLGIDFAVDAPEAVGSDRIANIVAAKSLVDKTAVVVDCGSATTLSFLSEGVFLGGAILPGIRMMRDTLKQQTAKLPAAPLLAPHHAIGSNTKAAIQSGIMLGTISAINGIINLAERERQRHFPIVLTGGHASYLHELFPKPVIVRHDLTMQGLRLIFLNNFS